MATNTYGLTSQPAPKIGNYFSYSYPIDLWQNPKRHGGNFMVFFVNVRNGTSVVNGGSVVNSKFGNNLLIGVDGKPITDNPISYSKLREKSSAGTQGRSSGIATKRTSNAVCLYIPENITMSHAMDYKEEELGILGSAVTGTESGVDLGLDIVKGISSTILSPSIAGQIGALVGGANGGARSAALGGAVAGGLASMIEKSNLTGNVGALTGIATNPHKEVLFQGVQFRKFNYKFNFFPKSLEESEQVEAIINIFRFHMHPEIASWSAGRHFIYPSDFDITFWSWDNDNADLQKENGHLYAAATCVLESIDINYTSTGHFITHKQGWPVGIEVVLHFKETEIMTKDRLMELEFLKFDNAQFLEGGQR